MNQELSGNALSLLFEGDALFRVSGESGAEIHFEGENKKRILVICDTGAGSLSPDEKKLLQKMLASLKLDSSDIALLTANQPPAFHVLKSRIFFNKLMLFGIEPGRISLNVSYEKNSPFIFSETEIIVSDNLNVFANNEQAKLPLWKGLKKMFGIESK